MAARSSAMNLRMIGFVLVAPIGMAQSQNVEPAPRPAFEVASIKPSAPGGPGVGQWGGVRYLPGTRMAARYASVRFLIQVAYGVRDFQVTGGPGWMNTEDYDITAKGDDGAQESQLRLMLQALLADRFKLIFHRETKKMPVYFLTVAKGGIKLVEPKEGSCVTFDLNGPQPTPGQPLPNFCGNMRRSSKGLDGFKIRMWQLTMYFSDVLRRPVIDKTDFKSTFDAHLEFARNKALTGILGNTAPSGPVGPPTLPADSSAPSIFTAVQEQLGLKLESTKGPVELLVIDQVERPNEN
jgi:uncharacterized protein (TIGR03435 family)